MLEEDQSTLRPRSVCCVEEAQAGAGVGERQDRRTSFSAKVDQASFCWLAVYSLATPRASATIPHTLGTGLGTGRIQFYIYKRFHQIEIYFILIK